MLCNGDTMRLAEFIKANTQPILAEWVAFAAGSGQAGKAMDMEALRDHAAEMLRTIVADLETRQSDAEQSEKSKGNAPPEAPGILTAAEVHGAGRAAAGFTLGEMVSEYRALRASVIRLWTEASGTLTRDDLRDLTRFNEAIDQATAESITRFMIDLDRSKEMFIAILGHDLRSPLNAVIMSSQFMLERRELKEPDIALATGSLRSARRMNQLVGDLLDFTRSRLGPGVPIVREQMDVGVVARHAVDEAAAANPKTALRITTSGALEGKWDASRITQVLANLIANAVQHGSPDTPVSVNVEGTASQVMLSVHNFGPLIPAPEIPRLFDPVKRLKPDGKPVSDGGHLGLGLYIAERIVAAHGGRIEVRSLEDQGTTFTVCLPR
jgi:signal transduction histidine kinase